ncbi:porin [Bradyrhizobium sp. Tv2a-2]|uniref:porin n=1 Tax=Bradyrhizobium sp. Tv2a-2 TaxID=113395 RepID=UPI0004292517
MSALLSAPTKRWDPMFTKNVTLLGTVAGLFVTQSAYAADLPVKAKAIEYVKACGNYGSGFWYVPGTDTCVRIGGYLRADTTVNSASAHGQPAWSGDSGQGNRFADHFVSRSRFALQVDTRTATEYGLVRTFLQGDFQFNNFGSSNPSTIGATPSALGGLSGSNLNGVGGGYVEVEYVFLQFGGFTFGKSASAYATPWQGFPGNLTSYLFGGQTSDTGVSNIQYTSEFGNGVSASIGLDDPTVYDRTPLLNLGVPGAIGASGTGSNAYGGWQVPDIVGRVRIDQAWGLFQISAAAHDVNASYNTLGAGGVPTSLSVSSGHPESKFGYAAMIGLMIKNLPTGTADDIKLDASFAKGATKYVIATSSTSPSFALFGSSGSAYQSVGFGATTDGVYLPTAAGGDGPIHLTTSWGVRGAFTHNWDPYWSTSLFGSYAGVSYDSVAKGMYCAAFGASHPGRVAVAGAAGSYSCNPDFNVSELGTVTRWTPVKNLTFSAEVMWFHLDQKMVGSSVFTPSAPQPTALYQFKDQNTVEAELRVQRNF